MLSKLTQLSQKRWLKTTLVFAFFFVFSVIISILPSSIPFTHAQDSQFLTPGETVGVSPAQKEEIENRGGGLGWVSSFLIEKAVYAVVYIIGLVASVVFALGGLLISFALDINSRVITSRLVHSGWSITRDIANLGFVLGILVIAFSTIIGRQTYGMKSLLTKFIVTALLINFSLVITGIILDFAGIITAFFASGAVGSGENWLFFSQKLAALTKVDELVNINETSLTAGADATLFGTTVLKEFSTLIFAAAFTVLAAIVLLGIAIMFIARYLHLAFLLILAPLAWFSGIFPGRINQSGEWWSKFLNWTFFAPISMFFLYLAVASIKRSEEFGLGFSDNSALDASFSAQTSFAQTFGDIGSLIVILGLMMASLLAAQKLGITGASMAIGWANKAKGMALRYSGNLAARAGRGAVRGTAGKFFTEERMKEWADKGGFLKKIAAKGGMRLAQGTAASKAAKQYEDFAKNIKDDDKLNFELQTAQLDPAKRAAIINEALKRGKIDKLNLTAADVSTFKTYYGGKVKKLTAANPLLSEDYLKATTAEEKEAAFRKAISEADPDDLSKWKPNKILERLRKEDEAKGNNDGETAFLKALGSITPRELSQITQGSLVNRREITNLIIKQKAEDLKIDYQQAEDAIIKRIATKEISAPPDTEIKDLFSQTDINQFIKSEDFQKAYYQGNDQAITAISSWLEIRRKDTRYTPLYLPSVEAIKSWDNEQAKKIFGNLKATADIQSYKQGDDYKKGEHLRLVDLLPLFTPEQKNQIKKTNPELFNYIKNINLASAGRKKKGEAAEEETPPTPTHPAPPPATP